MTDAHLVKSQHAMFISNLSRLVGGLRPMFINGSQHPSTFTKQDVTVSVSDTSRNTKTDKKGTSHSYGTFTIEYVENAVYGKPGSRAGQATAVLGQLCVLADKWNVSLRLRPMAVDDGPMDDAALTAWYMRLGFTEHDGLYLVRPPKF